MVVKTPPVLLWKLPRSVRLDVGGFQDKVTPAPPTCLVSCPCYRLLASLPYCECPRGQQCQLSRLGRYLFLLGLLVSWPSLGSLSPVVTRPSSFSACAWSFFTPSSSVLWDTASPSSSSLTSEREREEAHTGSNSSLIPKCLSACSPWS